MERFRNVTRRVGASLGFLIEGGLVRLREGYDLFEW